MDSIELFTGAGGLALGTHHAGFRHCGLYEYDKDACATLRSNASANALSGIVDWHIHQRDVRLNDYSPFRENRLDLVAGGPPCQPFSLGGKHKAQADSRNMIPEFVRAVREIRPRAFIMENVRGLARHSFDEYFQYILRQLAYPSVQMEPEEDWRSHYRRLVGLSARGRHKSTWYKVEWKLLNAADYGVPQIRHRIFIVGFRADLDCDWRFPEPTHSLDALLWKQHLTGEYCDEHGINSLSKMSVRLNGRIRVLRTAKEEPKTEPWVTVRDAFDGLPEPLQGKESGEFSNHKLILGARSYPGHTGSDLDFPAKALKAGVHGVPGGENMVILADGSVRYFTIRELARLQTFPDSWHFEGAWSKLMRQLGNAVPVRLAAAVADSVALSLRSCDSNRTAQRQYDAVGSTHALKIVANAG
ncbi:DNA cytosine methyltransferase [Archangium primigenium]|nr:DNA cytosine methyltransferase [Archangium primigenium]